MRADARSIYCVGCRAIRYNLRDNARRFRYMIPSRDHSICRCATRRGTVRADARSRYCAATRAIRYNERVGRRVRFDILPLRAIRYVASRRERNAGTAIGERKKEPRAHCCARGFSGFSVGNQSAGAAAKYIAPDAVTPSARVMVVSVGFSTRTTSTAKPSPQVAWKSSTQI